MLLEDTTAYVSALIPWGILAAVPLATIGAPDRSILFAFNLFLLPLSTLVMSFIKKKKTAVS